MTLIKTLENKPSSPAPLTDLLIGGQVSLISSLQDVDVALRLLTKWCVLMTGCGPERGTAFQNVARLPEAHGTVAGSDQLR